MNLDIFYFFYNFSHKTLFGDEVIIFLAEGLPYLVVVFAIFFILFHDDQMSYKNLSVLTRPFGVLKQKWKEFALLCVTSLSAWFSSVILKSFIMEPRPFVALQDVTALWSESGYAFPSGHATTFMALAFAIYLEHKRIGSYFIIFAILISLARIASGVHYPVDILGGFILGIIVAYLIRFLYKKL